MSTLVLCVCGQVAIALIGETEIPVCLTHYTDLLELASYRIRQAGRQVMNVTTGGVL